MFNSNLVCSFIMLLFLMAAQALIPAPRYDLVPPSSLSIFTSSSYLLSLPLLLLLQGVPSHPPVLNLSSGLHVAAVARPGRRV